MLLEGIVSFKCRLKPGFHIVVSVVSVVSVLRKKFIGQLQFYGNLPYKCSVQKKRQIQLFVRDRMNILSVLWIFFVRQTRQIQRYGNQALCTCKFTHNQWKNERKIPMRASRGLKWETKCTSWKGLFFRKKPLTLVSFKFSEWYWSLDHVRCRPHRCHRSKDVW